MFPPTVRFWRCLSGVVSYSVARPLALLCVFCYLYYREWDIEVSDVIVEWPVSHFNSVFGTIWYIHVYNCNIFLID